MSFKMNFITKRRWNELNDLKKRFLFTVLTSYKYGLLRRKKISFQFVCDLCNSKPEIQSLIRTFSLELLLLITCLSGDHIMTLSNVKKSVWAGALVDNTTHGAVGALSWAIVIDLDLDPQKIVACLICFLFSMAVDIDHFIAAKSLKLKAALSLERRPLFHATSPLLLVVILLWILSLFLKKILCLKTLSLCLITAVFSHHIRDASRHGLWLPPFGETTPLPIWLYITSTLILPLLVKIMYRNFVIFHV